MSALVLAVWLLSVPVPEDIATRKETPLTREEIGKRLQLAVRTPKASPLSELMAEGVRTLAESNRHAETLLAADPDAASEARFKAMLENEHKQINLTQYKLSVILDELLLQKDELAKAPRGIQAGYRYVCAHLEYRIAQLYEVNALMGEMRREMPQRQPGQLLWRLAPAPGDFQDRDAAKNLRNAREHLRKLIQIQPGTDWERQAAEELKGYFIGVKWEAGK